MTIFHEEDMFAGKGGTKLHYELWKPERTRAVVVGVHGVAEHTGRYAHVAGHFVNEGIAFCMFDLRGHGLSEGVRGHVDCYDDFVDDLDVFVGMVRGRERGKKLFLLGHSLGGVIAIDYGLRCPDKMDGVILSSPLLDADSDVPSDLLGKAVDLSKSDPMMMFQVPVDPYALSHDRGVCDKYAVDPLIFRMVSARFGVEVLQAAGRLRQSADKWVVPSLLLIAGEDRVCKSEGCEEFARGVKGKDFQVRVYDGFYHEIFNELGKERVFGDVDAWLNSRI